MIVDSSAVIGVLLREPGWEFLAEQLTQNPITAIGAPTIAETGIVLAARLGVPGKSLLARFIQEGGLTVVPFTDAHWPVAVDAFLRFGKGRHAAALTLGDCLTYALCRLTGESLLCIGDDFARTDLQVVRPA